MDAGDLVIVDDVPGEFTRRVTDAFNDRLSDSFSFALSGGDIARTCYERLADDAADQIDWWKVDIYWGHECWVPPDHPDSTYHLGRTALLERLGAVNANYPMRCEEGADPYQLRLGELGRIDVVHLAMGADGEVASLFPGSAALDADPGRLVVMTEDPSGRRPHRRMTLTYAGIAKARLVLVTATGEDKQEALAAVADGHDVPAARLRAGEVVWLVDPAAAGSLKA